MKQISFILLLCLCVAVTKSQPTSGTTGLLNIPTAEMQQDGTFMFGGNFLPKAVTPDRFNYDTGNYYLNITFLPFCEVNYRCTLFRNSGNHKYDSQDRSFALRLRVLKERGYIPAIVVGGNDIYTSSSGKGNQYFGAAYVVASKHLKWKKWCVAITCGCGINALKNNQYDGVFAGCSLNHNQLKHLNLLTEYDTKAFNAGISCLLFNHLYLYAFAYKLKRFTGGIQYRIYLNI